MAKRIGAVDQSNNKCLPVESLSGLSNEQAAEKVADNFAEVSNEYSPLDFTKLPSYLPALPPAQVNPYQVFDKLGRLKIQNQLIKLVF